MAVQAVTEFRQLDDIGIGQHLVTRVRSFVHNNCASLRDRQVSQPDWMLRVSAKQRRKVASLHGVRSVAKALEATR